MRRGCNLPGYLAAAPIHRHSGGGERNPPAPAAGARDLLLSNAALIGGSCCAVDAPPEPLRDVNWSGIRLRALPSDSARHHHVDEARTGDPPSW